ncbi:sulfur carrier protein ThiS [Fusobacterium necrogenes]|uniref:Sulfur carrier protein ThiS n=1 Tax=Fusobacterium necrogenes TaxID=858 RepID=A0A377GXI4_9FUSO|nr:sulfur carrier protein ThiS [Fusobacterium necrogenes]STO31314.1 sulfur carrier protein ThiS [Fusobacterium necrogenes]
MNIVLNGEKYEVFKEDITVGELLEELSVKWNIDLSGAVVLVNDEIVKKNKWETKKVGKDYHLEVLSFVSGG